MEKVWFHLCHVYREVSCKLALHGISEFEVERLKNCHLVR